MSDESRVRAIIDKSAVGGFLGELLGSGQVFAPLFQDQVLGMAPVESADEILRGVEDLVRLVNTRQAPKELFFPRSEVLFSYQDGKVIPVELPEERRIVFAMRPCDARSAALLDLVFDVEPTSADTDAASVQDPYYVNRRRNTVLMGLACNQPMSTCFCTSVGGGPFSTDGLDLLWTDLGDRYLVEAFTAQGEAMIADRPQMREAESKDVEQKAELAARAEGTISGPDVQGVKEKLDGMYDSPFWQHVHLKCLGCGACTYLCPTCHCFDIQDEGDRRQGQRVRNWDTCQFSLFTLHASGHNPRTSGKERMRQRMMHKFNYFVKNLHAIACVGCGRCVRECPVNLDIRAVLNGIQEAEE
jgi:sulfhydrogenase subunit beta (sulfur reductase)